MSRRIYDYRSDVRNIIVTPEIRVRIMRLEPASSVFLHSHDGAHETFVIFEGRCEFEVEGEREVLGPGQVLFCPAGNRHRLRVVGPAPVYLYLSVTPHHEPSHTTYDADGTPRPQYGLWRDPADPDFPDTRTAQPA
jgi:quercetin dioxygenase-like cupin family protein